MAKDAPFRHAPSLDVMVEQDTGREGHPGQWFLLSFVPWYTGSGPPCEEVSSFPSTFLPFVVVVVVGNLRISFL